MITAEIVSQEPLRRERACSTRTCLLRAHHQVELRLNIGVHHRYESNAQTDTCRFCGFSREGGRHMEEPTAVLNVMAVLCDKCFEALERADGRG